MNSFHCLENIHKEKRLTVEKSFMHSRFWDEFVGIFGGMTHSVVRSISHSSSSSTSPPPITNRILDSAQCLSMKPSRASFSIFCRFATHIYYISPSMDIFFGFLCVLSSPGQGFSSFFFLFVFCPSRGLRQRESLLFYIVFVATAIYDASIFLVNYSHIFFLKFFFSFGFSIRREMEDHNELDDRNSLTSHGSANADNDKVRRAPFQFGINWNGRCDSAAQLLSWSTCNVKRESCGCTLLRFIRLFSILVLSASCIIVLATKGQPVGAGWPVKSTQKGSKERSCPPSKSHRSFSVRRFSSLFLIYFRENSWRPSFDDSRH